MKRLMALLLALCGATAFSLAPDQIRNLKADRHSAASAAWLRGIWKKATGTTLRLLPEGEDSAKNTIYLGEAALKSSLVSEKELAQVPPEGFVLKIRGDAVGIASRTPEGILCGAGRLGELLGFRANGNSFFPPRRVPENLEECTISDSPAFFYRNGGNPLTGQLGMLLLGDPRRGADPELFGKKSDLWIDHTAGYLVPKLKYYDRNPEYYALLKDGKRIAKNAFSDHRTPLCLSNPDVARIALERAREWVRLNPDKKFFFLTYGDTTIWCECPGCRKLDDAGGRHAGRLLHWVNAIAGPLEKEFPGRIFLTFAYSGTETAPEGIRPAGNVAVVVASSLGNRPFFAHELKRNGLESMLKILDGWIAKNPGRVLVCEYIGGSYQPAFVSQTADRYRFLRKRGVGGIAFHYGNPANFPKLWTYLHGKLLWNPDQDAMKLMEEYAPLVYGDAASAVTAYLKLADAQYRQTLASGKPLKDGYPPDFYTAEFVEKACGLLSGAIARAGSSGKIAEELTREKYLFLTDAMRHLSDYRNEKLVTFILNEGSRCAKRLKKENEFARSNDLVLRELEKTLPPERGAALKKLFGHVTGAVPERSGDTLRFPVTMWSGQDYGPREYGPKQDPLSPPKLCSGVFTKARGGRITSSAEMSLLFDLPESDAGRGGVLQLEGQDAVTKNASAQHLRNKETTMMRITLNDAVIYEGVCGFAVHNWSRREFRIPAGVLRRENNRLVIRNAGYARGAFVYCWILICDASIRFDAPPEKGK